MDQPIPLVAGIAASFSPAAFDGDFVTLGLGPVVVRVVGGTVVPGIVVPGIVVPGMAEPLMVVAGIVDAGIVMGSFTVPGMVVVYVAPSPSSLPGMAAPTPLLVHAGGRTIVLVLGLEASSPA